MNNDQVIFFDERNVLAFILTKSTLNWFGDYRIWSDEYYSMELLLQ